MGATDIYTKHVQTDVNLVSRNKSKNEGGWVSKGCWSPLQLLFFVCFDARTPCSLRKQSDHVGLLARPRHGVPVVIIVCYTNIAGPSPFSLLCWSIVLVVVSQFRFYMYVLVPMLSSHMPQPRPFDSAAPAVLIPTNGFGFVACVFCRAAPRRHATRPDALPELSRTRAHLPIPKISFRGFLWRGSSVAGVSSGVGAAGAGGVTGAGGATGAAGTAGCVLDFVC